MSLFPDSILRKYQNDSPLPDILKIFHLSSAELDTNPQDLIKYSEAFILLSNHLNPSSSSSIILENFATYSDIQEKFNRFYQKTPSDSLTIDQLLKAEQSIHLITSEHTLQDASTHLKMLRESYTDGSRFCQLILLLSKRHTLWNDEQSATQHHWMNFLLPFFHFLDKFGFDFDPISSQELSIRLQTYMKEIIQTDVTEEMQNQESKWKKKDYYKLGLLSLGYYIKRFISSQDFTLFKISILAQCYLDEIRTSSSHVQGKSLLAMYKLDAIALKDNSIINMVAWTISAFAKEDAQRVPLFSLLDYAFLRLHNEARSKMSLFFQSSQPLLFSLFDIIQKHKQELQSLASPKYSLFSDYYNSFMWSLLRLVRVLKYNLSQEDTNIPALLSFYQEKIIPIFSKEPLDIFIKGQFYQGFKDSFCYSIPTTFINFQDTLKLFNINLENILLLDSNDEDPYQLFLDFRTASSFIRIHSYKKELIAFSASQEIQDLRNDFLAIIAQKEPHQYAKLKYIGIFLLNLFALSLPTDQENFMSFAKSFLSFLMQTQIMTLARPWDLEFLRETLRPIFEKTDISLQDCFYDCLNLFKGSISEFRYPSLNLNDDLLAKIKGNVEAKEKCYKSIIESCFAEIEENYAKTWKLEPINPFDGPDIKRVLQKQTNTLFCYLIPWIEKFTKLLKPEDDLYRTKLQNISNRLILLHLHPLFTYTDLLKEYKKLYRSTLLTEFLSPLTIVQSLQIQIYKANQMLVSGLLQKEDLFQLKICLVQEEQFITSSNQHPKTIIKDYDQNQNNLMILIQSLSLTFIKFNKILSYSQSFKGIQHDQPVILETLKSFLKSLCDFLSRFMDLFDQDQGDSADNFLNNCFEFLANLTKYFLPTSDELTKLFFNFYKDLLMQQNNWDFSSRYYGMIFQSVSPLCFREATPKKLFTLIFFEYQAWANHIEKIQNFAANSKNSTKNINLVSQFYRKLNRDIFMNSVFQDYPPEFVKTTLLSIISYVKQKLIGLSDSIWKIIPENSALIHILLKEIFIVFLNSFSSLNQTHSTAMREVKGKIVRLQEQFEKTSQEIETQQTAFQNLQTNQDLSAQEKSEKISQSLEAISSLKTKISQAKQDMKNYEQNLQDLVDENRPVIEIFQAVIDQFAFIFPFSNVSSFDSELIKSSIISRKSIETFILCFNNFNQNISNDNIITNTLTFFRYSHILTNLLLCFPQQLSFEPPFFASFLTSSQSLFQSLFDSPEFLLSNSDELIKKYNFFTNLATLLGEAAGIGLSFYKAKFFNQPQATLTDISKPVLEWIETILKMFTMYQNFFSLDLFDPEPFYRNLFAALIGFMQLLQVSDPQTAFEEFIKKESSAIRVLLSSKKTSPWGKSFSILIVSFFDDFFRISLPFEHEIPLRIKEYLISHPTDKLKLTNLCEKVSLIREKELLCMELMVSSLQDHFHFEKLQNKNIFITIDPSKETKDPISQVQNILHSLSSSSIQALKLLLDVLVENFLYNVQQIKQIRKVTPKTPFKDITSIINILAPLLSKYPQFIFYLVFQKENFTDSKEVIPFINYLFKLEFFTFYPDDSLPLIKALLSHTGVLFSQDGQTALDSNILVASHLLSLLNRQLDSKSEHPYMTFCSVMRIFGFIWKAVGEIQNQAAHDVLNPKILFTLKRILAHINRHSKIHSLLSLNSQGFDYVLTENLKEWSKKQLIKLKISEADLTQIREQNYKSLLQNDLLASSDFYDLTPLLDQLTEQSFSQPLAFNISNHTTDLRKKDYMIRTIESSYHVDFEFNFPVHKDTNISNDEVFSSLKAKQVKRCQILSQHAQDEQQLIRNLGIYLKQWSFDIDDSRFEKKFPNYFPPKTIKCSDLFSIPKEQTFKFEPPTRRFYHIIEENLFPASETQPKNPPPQSHPKKQEFRVLKYFLSSSMQKSEDFEHAKQVLLERLKSLTEQLLVETLYLEEGEEENKATHHQASSKIITHELTRLTEFNGNLLLCLADQFEPFKLLPVPEEMRKEFIWITNNLSEYILVMKTLFGESHSQTSNTPTKTVYDGFSFPTDFAFCIDQPIALRNKGQKKQTQQEELPGKKPCLMIDEIVESMMSLLLGHYIQSGWKSNNNSALEFITQLCHSSPVIEIKFIDYCLSVLYNPPHNDQFLVSNALNFLQFYFGRVNHLIYLPRVLFEKYSVTNRQSYIEKTTGKLSMCDLLIGLLEEGESLLSEVRKILTNIFSKPVNFEIIQIEREQELEEKYHVLSHKSSHALSKAADIDNLLLNLPDMVLYEYQSITENFMNKVHEVFPILESSNQALNTRLIVNKEKFVPADVKEILVKKRSQNKTMGNILCDFSCVLSTMNKPNDSISQNIQNQREQNLEKFLSHLEHNFFNNKQVKDMILHFFELLKYLTHHERFFKSENIKFRMIELFKICLFYFTLQSFVPRSNHEELNFDALLKDTPSNYRDILFESFTNSKELDIRDLVICQALPQLTDLNFKKKFLLDKIKQDQQGDSSSVYYESLRTISVDRKNLLKSTINEICFSTLRELKKPLKVTFKSEYGVDAGGLRREFYTIICQELFDPLKGLFMLDEKGMSLQPSPASRIVSDRLIYFELAGIMLAKAISQDILVDVTLSNGLLKHILGQTVGLNELREMDSALAKNLEWMLSNPVSEELEQQFLYENTLFGRKVTKELVPKGHEITINADTKQDFVRKLTEFKMQKEIKQELEAFLKGFHLVLNPSWLILFSPSELQGLISGDAILNVEEMKLHAQYSGYTQDSDIIKWLWEVLQDFSQKELAAFLFFVSGSKRISKNGLANTPIRYRKAGPNSQRLPTAATCSWAIDIPEYESKEALKQKLLLAIFEGQQNFQLG